ISLLFFFQAEDGIRDFHVTGVQTCALPIYREDWLLENFLALGLVAVLIATYQRFPFSDVSYILLALFLTLHAIGAHYTYAKVPRSEERRVGKEGRYRSLRLQCVEMNRCET